LADERPRAYCELARVLRPGAWMLVSFHVESPTAKPGDAVHRDIGYQSRRTYLLACRDASDAPLASVTPGEPPLDSGAPGASKRNGDDN
jgi:hypothetical protein